MSYKEAYDWLQNKLKIKNKNPSTYIGGTVPVNLGNTFWGSVPEKDKIPTNVSYVINKPPLVDFNSPEKIEESKTFIPPKMIDITKKPKRKISLEDKL